MLRSNDVVGGGYQVIQEIGHGGTGVVYLAYHLNLRKYIVLKKITAQISNMEALRREADILKNLRHTNIPQIYDFVVENGEVFTVMDYIEGEPLSSYISAANTYPEEQLLNWFRELSDVLVYLQERRIPVIHSDIKPANIMITPQGDPVLIDFNISFDQIAEGGVIGFSRNYASPEQIWLASEIKEGRRPSYRLDGRTDIYSLGAVFYSLITGITPDSRYILPKLESMQGLMYSQSFLAMIDKCVEWDREKRFRNAGKLAAAVRNLYRMDRNYRRYTLMRVLSLMLSAVLIAAGFYCMAHGFRLNNAEQVRLLYSEASEAASAGDFTSAGEKAKQILNKPGYCRQLDDYSVAELNHAAGDSAYILGNYREASEYYGEAAEMMASADRDRSAGYYSDLALAYLKAGDMTELKLLSDECAAEGIASDDLELVKAAAFQQNGETEKCLYAIRKILKNSADKSLKAKACTIAAQCYGDENVKLRLEYLRTAFEYTGEVKYARECAALEYSLAGNIGLSESERKNHAERAVKLYELLCKTAAPQTTDQVNLGISYYFTGKYSEAQNVLQKASKSSDDYRIKMYQAMTAEMQGDKALAISMCSEATELCLSQKPVGWEEDYETLKDLSNRLF